MPTRWNLYNIVYVDLKEGTCHEQLEASQTTLDTLKLNEEKCGDIQVLSVTFIGTDGIGGKKIFNKKMQKTKKF